VFSPINAEAEIEGLHVHKTLFQRLCFFMLLSLMRYGISETYLLIYAGGAVLEFYREKEK